MRERKEEKEKKKKRQKKKKYEIFCWQEILIAQNLELKTAVFIHFFKKNTYLLNVHPYF